MNVPSASTLTNVFNYTAAFISALVALLIGFDWLAFFTPEQALKIVGGLNLVGLFAKAWMSTAEQMAKNMAAK
jgi:hypothetical protein